MTRKVLATLREALRDAQGLRTEYGCRAEEILDPELVDALAWLDAFEKHAPAIEDALVSLIDNEPVHWEDEVYQAALDWLEGTLTGPVSVSAADVESTTKDEGE